MKKLFLDEQEIKSFGIYLAGDINLESNYNYSWRKDAVELLEKEEYKGWVYIPELKEKNELVTTNLDTHISWELEAYAKASIILFWISSSIDEYSFFKTMVDFGRLIATYPKKLYFGYDVALSEHIQYIDYLYERECKRVAQKDLKNLVREVYVDYIDRLSAIIPSTDYIKYTDEDFLQFKKTGECELCGTQRCLADLDMLHTVGPCGAFKNWLKTKNGLV